MSQLPTIMIVSTDDEFHRLMQAQLVKQAKVIALKNGAEAMMKIFDLFPQVIVAEYNLAGTNGVKLCNALKFDIRTKAIPFILLEDKQHTVEPTTGIEVGPEVKLTFPYTIEQVIAEIQQFLINKEDQNVRFFVPGFELKNLSEAQQKTVLQLQNLIESHLSNELFSIEELADQMNMSRMQLYRFTKEVFSCSPNQLLKEQRLLKAKQLLESKSISIAEVARKCGFSQPAYFSKCFKEKYSCNPKEYQLNA